jgi:hypothetical protein
MGCAWDRALHFKQLYETIVLKAGNVNPRVARSAASASHASVIASALERSLGR